MLNLCIVLSLMPRAWQLYRMYCHNLVNVYPNILILFWPPLNLYSSTTFFALIVPTTSRYRASRWGRVVPHRGPTCTWGSVNNELLSMYMCHVLAWHCYINDVFIICNGTIDLLHEFLASINNDKLNLKFTMPHISM